MTDIFPLVYSVDEFRLLTAIGLGFLFGFSLERAGFGNARKLAAQFYLHDMTVFKVMFTAILVAMVGLRLFSSVGWLDMSQVWINPTFLWAQVVGGFLLGAGFIMSGLCPGTSVVSAASGRIDGLVTIAGIFVGSFLFAVLIDWFPLLEVLYTSGSLGESVLPTLLGAPPLLVALGIVVVAGLAFVGAERVERAFRQRHEPVELSPTYTKRTPRLKFAVSGSLAVLAIVGLSAASPRSDLTPELMVPIEPLALAEEIIKGNPNVVIIDVRDSGQTTSVQIPGSITVTTDEQTLDILSSLALSTTVVVYDQQGDFNEVPLQWPTGLDYRNVRGGVLGWETDVLTPANIESHDSVDIESVRRQNQIAAYFAGVEVQTTVEAPPVVQSSGPRKKKKSFGC